MPTKNPGRGAVGGTRPVEQRPFVNERAAAFEPDPRVAAALRSLWGRRRDIRSGERALVFSFLRQAQRRILSGPQLAAIATIAERLRVGFDDPRNDDPAAMEPKRRSPQPWGALPLKPPGR